MRCSVIPAKAGIQDGWIVEEGPDTAFSRGDDFFRSPA